MLVHIIVMFFAQSYKDILRRDGIKEIKATIMHMCYCLVLIIVGVFLLGIDKSISRTLILKFCFVGIGILYIGRVILKYMIKNWVLPRQIRRYVTIITTIDEVYSVVDNIKGNTYRNYRINNIFLVGEVGELKYITNIPVVYYSKDKLRAYLKNQVVDEVFISLPAKVELPQGILKICYQMDITVHMKLIRRGYEMGTKTLEVFAGYPVLTSGMKIAKPYQVLIKRILDVVCGLIGILLTAVIIVIIGPIIYFKDPGPIFFAQTRIGKNGRKFKIYKFRSMYMDAEKRKEELIGKNEMQGFMFRMKNDPRILPGIGDKIRSLSLDEFPKFLNVLKGDMSLVGTWAPTEDEWGRYDYKHCRCLDVKPGMIGLWQVSGTSDITNFEEIMELDTRYITDWNLILDIKIILKAIFEVFTKIGHR